MTRGQRNNNPLNIRRTADRWYGMSPKQTDREFIVFVNLEYGIRAAIKLIRRYIQHYSCDSVRKIIYRWAPPCENDTESYIAYVTTKVGIMESEHIKHDDMKTICKIISAMAQVESQMKIPAEDIQRVWNNYFWSK